MWTKIDTEKIITYNQQNKTHVFSVLKLFTIIKL